MTTAFVLGNGISRRDVNLIKLKQHGTIYGCNALYREFTPDVLVATDTPIATQIQESGYAKTNKFYTRRPIIGLQALQAPPQYSGYSSGPLATGIAAIDRYATIFLLGFDMGPTKDNLFNNIYADTEFYKTTAHPPTFTGNWVRQIKQITLDHPDTQFFRICGETTAKIPELTTLKNLEHQDMTWFLNRINNKKDL
jgi:hypothetical protein